METNDDLVLAVDSLEFAHDRTDYQMSDGAVGDSGDTRDP